MFESRQIFAYAKYQYIPLCKYPRYKDLDIQLPTTSPIAPAANPHITPLGKPKIKAHEAHPTTPPILKFQNLRCLFKHCENVRFFILLLFLRNFAFLLQHRYYAQYDSARCSCSRTGAHCSLSTITFTK